MPPQFVKHWLPVSRDSKQARKLYTAITPEEQEQDQDQEQQQAGLDWFGQTYDAEHTTHHAGALASRPDMAVTHYSSGARGHSQNLRARVRMPLVNAHPEPLILVIPSRRPAAGRLLHQLVHEFLAGRVVQVWLESRGEISGGTGASPGCPEAGQRLVPARHHLYQQDDLLLPRKVCKTPGRRFAGVNGEVDGVGRLRQRVYARPTDPKQSSMGLAHQARMSPTPHQSVFRESTFKPRSGVTWVLARSHDGNQQDERGDSTQKTYWRATRWKR